MPPLVVDALTSADVVDKVMGAISTGEGGWIAPVNVDVLRQATREPGYRDLLERATITLPDGVPILWAARLAGTPLPGRVPGSDLIFTLSEAAAHQGHSVYLLGGAEGVPERAASELARRYQGLRVVGAFSPPFGFDQTEEGLAEIHSRLSAAEPAIVFVGLGFPKQERLIVRMRQALPRTWFLACGAAIPFAAGDLVRAPVWMQRTGLEWSHRLASEPGRLAHRYLIQDAPFAAQLLVGSLLARSSRSAARPRPAGTVSVPAAVTLKPERQPRPESIIDLREPTPRPVVVHGASGAENGGNP
jgi:N-acetylglucosaminyldiphosphoundecaprenol N-acetyl-beta-D-mannosaminyltransferase